MPIAPRQERQICENRTLDTHATTKADEWEKKVGATKDTEIFDDRHMDRQRRADEDTVNCRTKVLFGNRKWKFHSPCGI